MNSDSEHFHTRMYLKGYLYIEIETNSASTSGTNLM
jgi:hypothetical protein